MYAYEKPEKKKAKNSNAKKKILQSTETQHSSEVPKQMKAHFENLSGFSFNEVRVHYNSDKPAQLQAYAYTQGNHIYIGSGHEKYIKHELGHVVQQKQGRVNSTMQFRGMSINDDEKLEKEADSMFYKASLNEPLDKKELEHADFDGRVIQRTIIDVEDVYGYQWFSNDAFDDHHLVDDFPTSDQGWIDLRLDRWPGFGGGIHPDTFIETGALIAALEDGEYYDYQEPDESSFTVKVRCPAYTVTAYNPANALTVNNVRIIPYNAVKLGGYFTGGGSCVISHCSGGI